MARPGPRTGPKGARVSDTVTQSTRALLGFILRESNILRSPVLLFMIVASASRTALIYLINESAEAGGPTGWLLPALFGAAAVMLLTTHWGKMAGIHLVVALGLRMRSYVVQRLLTADVSFFQNQDYGTIYHGSTGHVNAVASTTVKLAEIVQTILLLLFVLGYMLLQMPISVVATAIALVIGVAAFFATERPATRAVQKSHNATVAMHNSIHDMLGGYKELRLQGAKREAISQIVAVQMEEAKRLSVISERHYSYGQVSAQGSLAMLLVALVTMLPLVAGADSVTTLQILTLVLFSFGPIEQMIGDLPNLAKAGISYQIYTDLLRDLEQNSEVEDARQEHGTRDSFKKIELRGVKVVLTRDVGEDDRAQDTFTLGPLDLTLEPGQSVFITGGNGMGKSTLLQLLTGLRHPTEGQILIDGTPVTRENVNSYRSVFASVFSEFYMFRKLYGLTEDEKARMMGHIEELGIAEGVSLGEDSFNNLSLSTGQMRRLALSIAMAEKRPILVLDEFAADQDPERRRFFYDELVPRLAAAGHCVVAVTHDEHCFGKADRLIRMADGQILSDELTKR